MRKIPLFPDRTKQHFYLVLHATPTRDYGPVIQTLVWLLRTRSSSLRARSRSQPVRNPFASASAIVRKRFANGWSPCANGPASRCAKRLCQPFAVRTVKLNSAFALYQRRAVALPLHANANDPAFTGTCPAVVGLSSLVRMTVPASSTVAVAEPGFVKGRCKARSRFSTKR